MQHVKVVVVGDGAVGKSCFLISWTTNSFPQDYVPTVFDNYGSNVMVNGAPVSVSLWDTAGQEDYDRLRPLSYPLTDVFLVCFSIASRTSFENARSKWVPEVNHYCPQVPVVLIGMKSDLRTADSNGEGGASRGRGSQVSTEEGHQLAKDVGALGYYETSSLQGTGVNQAMMEALSGTLNNRATSKKRRGGFRWPWKRSKKNSSRGDNSSTSEPGIPPPPELPINEKAPWINIPSSTLAEDWGKLVNNPKQSDVIFELESKSFYAHKLVLCMASDLFRAIFGLDQNSKKKVKSLSKSVMWNKHRLQKVSMATANAGYVEGIISVQTRQMESAQCNDTVTVFTLDPAYFTEEIVSRCLTFLYCGVVDLKQDSDQLAETITAANFLNLPELATICENAQKGEEFLNPSIGTWLNDRNSEVAKELFLNKELLADVHFRVEGQVVAAHKLILCQRSEVMSAMLTGGFKESNSELVELPEITLETFLALLEYLYTDHAPIEEGDAVGIMALSNQYAVSRLMGLCELYISKEVERRTADSIAQADLNVIHLLLTSQLYNASQLSSWCLHFISSNYLAYCEQESFSQLQGDNLDHVTSHRWPPVSYEKEMEEYRKKYLETEEDENEDHEGEAEPSASSSASSKTKKGKGMKKRFSLNRLVRGLA